MPLVPGSRLDAYELVRPLGAGGMGEVWLATEERLGRKVALKLLPADLTSDTSRIERFEQEARAASSLSHPNVCTIHALAQTADGQHYIAMEYVEGQTLRNRLLASRLTLRESLDIVIQIALALSAAHAQGIVHRDMKPENVMLRPDGFVKVLDFGLAKLVPAHQSFEAEQTRATFMTDAGTVVGTVAYMSPEQARGQDVDARNDVWALGCILYEMVAGRSPFAASNSSDVLAAILDKDPAPIARFEPDVPPELQRIVTKALRKDRAQRYQTTQDLLLDLQALRDELHLASSSGRMSAVTADTGRASTQRSDPARRQRRYLLLVAALSVAGVIAGAVWWRNRGPTQPPRNVGVAVPRNLTRLTVGAGLQTDATFSPDGHFFAYASDRAGNFDIWVQPVAGGDPVRITRSPADDTQPDWSPDGSTIAFHSERDGGGIYVVAALGGTERRLVAGGERPAWSPDGRLVLFLKGVEVPGAGPPMQYSAYSIADDRETPLWPAWFVFDAAWHPDGRITAIGVDRRNLRSFKPEFLTGGVDGTSIAHTALPSDCPEAIRQAFPNGVGRLSWSPKGTQLFMQVSAGQIDSVWRLSVDPQTLVAAQCERLTMGAERQSGLSLSRDGTRLAYTAQSDATRLWRVRLDGDTKREAPAPLTDEEGEVATYDVSPDGKRIALEMRHRGTEQTELQVLDVANKSTSTLGGDGVLRVQPRWSPDGHRVAYHHVKMRSSGRESSLAVWDTTSPEHIIGRHTVPGSLVPFDWTADGRFLLVSQTSRAPAVELWSAAASPPATTAAKQLIKETDSFIWQERYSPDGRWLSFVNVPTRPGSTPMVQIAPAGDPAPAQWRRIAPSFSWTDKPRWSPDGRRLYFLARDGGVFNVWVVPFDASRGEARGTPTQVTRFYPPNLTISPDLNKVELGVTADSLVLPLKHVAGSIWMLDNVDK